MELILRNLHLHRKSYVRVKNDCVEIPFKSFINLSFSLKDQSSGSAKDWTYGVLNIQYSYGVELRPHFNGSYAFLIPPDQIKPCGEEITAAIKALSTTVHLNEGRRSVRSKRDRSHEHK